MRMNNMAHHEIPRPLLMLKYAEIGRITCFNYFTGDECTSGVDNPRTQHLENLYIGTEKGEIYVWNVHDPVPTYKKEIGSSSIIAIHFFERYLVTQEKEGRIKVLEVVNDELKEAKLVLNIHPSFCKSITVKNLIFTASECVDIHDLNTGTILKGLIHNEGRKYGMIMCLTKVTTTDCTDYILAVYETGEGMLWSYTNPTIMDRIGFKPEPLSACFEKSRSRGVVVGVSKTIQIFEVQQLSFGGMKILYEIDVPTEGSLNQVLSRKDGKMFVVGGTDKKVRCFSWRTLALVAVLQTPYPITDVCLMEKRYCSCAKPLAASNTEGCITFWDIR